jgi:hypothetical protein
MSTRRSSRKAKAPAKFEAGPASTYESGDGLILFPNSPAPKRAAKTPVKKPSAKKPAAKKTPAKTPTRTGRSKTPVRKSTARKPKIVEEPEEESDDDDEDHEEPEEEEEDDDDESGEEEEPEPKIMLQDDAATAKPGMLMNSSSAVGSMILVASLNFYLSSESGSAEKLGMAHPVLQAATFMMGVFMLTNMLRTLMLTTDFDDLIFGTTDAKTGMAGVGIMIASSIIAYTNFTIIALTPATNASATDEENVQTTEETMNSMTMSKNDVIVAQIFVYVFSMLSILAVVYLFIENENFENFTFSKPKFNNVGEENDNDGEDSDDDDDVEEEEEEEGDDVEDEDDDEDGSGEDSDDE